VKGQIRAPKRKSAKAEKTTCEKSTNNIMTKARRIRDLRAVKNDWEEEKSLREKDSGTRERRGN